MLFICISKHILKAFFFQRIFNAVSIMTSKHSLGYNPFIDVHNDNHKNKRLKLRLPPKFMKKPRILSLDEPLKPESSKNYEHINKNSDLIINNEIQDDIRTDVDDVEAERRDEDRRIKSSDFKKQTKASFDNDTENYPFRTDTDQLNRSNFKRTKQNSESDDDKFMIKTEQKTDEELIQECEETEEIAYQEQPERVTQQKHSRKEKSVSPVKIESDDILESIEVKREGSCNDEVEKSNETKNGSFTRRSSDEGSSSQVPNTDSEDTNDEEDIPVQVRSELTLVAKSFPGLSHKYKLMDKIGEGTFSSVYKAMDLRDVTKKSFANVGWMSQMEYKRGHPLVALKLIYVTSSPQRILNELQLLHSLVGCPNVAPLVDALRYEDQVIAVLPYYKHADFRDFYRDLPLSGIRIYMRELLEALSFVHEKKIIHRDIKPTNFLYDPFTRRGVLVDFGLAERECVPDPSACPCVKGGLSNDEIPPENILPTTGYLKDDSRPGRRANRAGTRGFRAPEVLFKCPNQTTKIDIWSAGVMLLTLLARRFPFFNSSDDIDALTELTAIFGRDAMKKCARLHGLGFECNLPHLEYMHPFGSIVYVAVLLDAREGDTFADDSPAWELLSALDKNGRPTDTPLGKDYAEALALLRECLTLDYKERVTADEALQLDFFTRHTADTDEVLLG